MINKYALKFWPCRCIGTWWSLNSNPVVSYCNVNDIMSTFKISANVNYHGIWCVVFVCALYVVYLSHVHVSCINNHGIRNHGFPLESKWIFVLFPWKSTHIQNHNQVTQVPYLFFMVFVHPAHCNFTLFKCIIIVFLLQLKMVSIIDYIGTSVLSPNFEQNTLSSLVKVSSFHVFVKHSLFL